MGKSLNFVIENNRFSGNFDVEILENKHNHPTGKFAVRVLDDSFYIMTDHDHALKFGDTKIISGSFWMEHSGGLHKISDYCKKSYTAIRLQNTIETVDAILREIKRRYPDAIDKVKNIKALEEKRKTEFVSDEFLRIAQIVKGGNFAALTQADVDFIYRYDLRYHLISLGFEVK